jgi:predicted amidophosphoribosyltransferase
MDASSLSNTAMAGQICPQCDKAKSSIDRLVVLGEYREILREAVIACKRMSFSPLAANLGDLIAFKIREVAKPSDFGAVTYVPSHWYRRMKRGGVPTCEIARRVASGLGVPLANLLTINRQTAKQGMLGDRERRENVSGAFGVKKGYALRAPRILVVDDVWTTGSTIREVAKQLRQRYDAEIWATVVARAIGSHAN